MKDKIVVYVAAPYSKGRLVLNIRQALAHAERLTESGFIPIIPHLLHFWDLIYPHDYDFWLQYCFVMVNRCDCLLRVPGDSYGAAEEVKFAKEKNIPVFYNIQELCGHYK